MEKLIKCFSEDHKEINAISFCPKCQIYMCKKCENIHLSFFKNHNFYNINKDEEIFTGFCKEKNHYELKYYCKDHNQLCCVSCIAKLNEDGEGQHKNCQVCYIDKIKEEKKNKLKENIILLENLQNKFSESIESLKKIFEEIEKDKEKLKLEIQNIFTKIRNYLNDREEQLLLDVDNLYNNKFFDENIIKKAEKLPKKIKESIEKGKIIDKEWDKYNIFSNINDCINIENNIININIIKENINKFNLKNKIKFNFNPKGCRLDNFLENIKSFGKINESEKYYFRELPLDLDEKRKCIVSGDNNNIFTKTGRDNYFCGIICKNELDKSIEEHKWKVNIITSTNTDIYVGVAPIDFDIHFNTLNHTNCGWYFRCSNSSLYSGPPFKYDNYKTNLSKVKNEIIIIMNMKKRALKFIINSEDKGDSYTDLPIDKPLYPAICLINKGDSVQINSVS